MLPTDPALERTLRGHRAAVNALAFSPNGRQLASGGADNTVMVWNFTQQMRAYRYLGHTVRPPPRPQGGTRLLGRAARPPFCRHALLSPRPPPPAQGAVNAVAFAPNGSLLASASSDHTVRLWKPSV
jgi:WD40 repeat protein